MSKRGIVTGLAVLAVGLTACGGDNSETTKTCTFTD